MSLSVVVYKDPDALVAEVEVLNQALAGLRKDGQSGLAALLEAAIERLVRAAQDDVRAAEQLASFDCTLCCEEHPIEEAVCQDCYERGTKIAEGKP